MCIFQLGARLVLTVINFMKGSRTPLQMDSTLMDTLNELYELVCRAGITRLKPGTMLSSLLSCEEEPEARRKQKYENIIEDMRSVNIYNVSFLLAYLE